MTEIERKFLVTSRVYRDQAVAKHPIAQGYLSSHPERTVRIRIKNAKGYVTVKGASSANGLSRFEWEKEIPVAEAQTLLSLCEPGAIEKIRYEIPHGPHTIEVDEFSGANEGLILAEIELSEEDEAFEKPSWLGKEVTGDSRYYNAQLTKNPYKQWPADTTSKEL